MKTDFLDNTIKSIQEKIGEEASGLIADDIGNLITANKQALSDLDTKSQRIATLEDNNQKLIIANGNLLKQVPMASESEAHQNTKEAVEEKKSFNFRSVFDKNGRFRDDL